MKKQKEIKSTFPDFENKPVTLSNQKAMEVKGGTGVNVPPDG